MRLPNLTLLLAVSSLMIGGAALPAVSLADDAGVSGSSVGTVSVVDDATTIDPVVDGDDCSSWTNDDPGSDTTPVQECTGKPAPAQDPAACATTSDDADACAATDDVQLACLTAEEAIDRGLIDSPAAADRHPAGTHRVHRKHRAHRTHKAYRMHHARVFHARR